MAHITQKLSSFRDHLIKLNYDRKVWLFLSGGAFFAIVGIILGWNKLTVINSNVIWTIIALGAIILAVAWWYWTMMLIRKLLEIQIDVVDILKELTTDIKVIRVEVKDIFTKN